MLTWQSNSDCNGRCLSDITETTRPQLPDKGTVGVSQETTSLQTKSTEANYTTISCIPSTPCPNKENTDDTSAIAQSLDDSNKAPVDSLTVPPLGGPVVTPTDNTLTLVSDGAPVREHSQPPVVSGYEEEEEPDELACLDEDLEQEETTEGLIDSELDSLGSPIIDRGPIAHNTAATEEQQAPQV